MTVTYASPRNAGFSGGRISTAGDTLWFYAQKMTPRFEQNVVQVDPVDGVLVFYADRDITGTLVCEGLYGASDGHILNALAAMGKERGIGQETLSLDTGVNFTGTLVLLSVQYGADVNAKDERVPVKIVFRFTGQITGDGGSSGSIDGGSSGEISLNLKSVAGVGRMSLTTDYVDQRGTRAVEPFIVVGIREDSGVPLKLAEQRVVASLGADPTWRGDSTLPFSRVVNTSFLGVNLIGGMLVYDRNATDCLAYQYRSELGFLVRGKELDFITGDSGSDPDDVCTSIAEGAFAARLARWVDRTQAYTIHLIPCIFDSHPNTNAQLKAMLNAINSNTIAIEGVNCDPYTLWFRGVDGIRKYTSADGTSKYFGYLNISELDDGWTDGKLICAQSVPVDIPGQTAPGYTVRASVRQLYQYDRVTFQTIAQLCPNCYGA